MWRRTAGVPPAVPPDLPEGHQEDDETADLTRGVADDIAGSLLARFGKRYLVLAQRFGPTMLATLASQGAAALGLLSIVLLGSQLSDSYSLAIQIGLSAFSGVVLQVLYLVAIGRPWMRSWTAWYWATALFSILFAAGVIAIDGSTPDKSVMIAIFGVGGAFLGLAGVKGVQFACLGRPLVMASLTIAPSTCLALASLAIERTGMAHSGGQFVPAALWASASIAVWVVCARKELPELPSVSHVDQADTRSRLHTATLLVGLIGNTIYPSLFLAALSRLPDGGTTTALFIVSRVGTSIVGLFVNSILTVRYNWSTEVPRSGPAVFWATGGAVASGAAGLALHAYGLNQFSFVFTGLCWLAALIAVPPFVREINARRMVLANAAKTLVDLIVVISIGSWFIARPSTSGFFGVYVALQAATLISCAIPLRRPAIAVVSAALLVIGLGQVFFAW